MSRADNRTTLQEYLTSDWQEIVHADGLGAVVMAIADGSVRVQQQVQQAAGGRAAPSSKREREAREIVDMAARMSTRMSDGSAVARMSDDDMAFVHGLMSSLAKRFCP